MGGYERGYSWSGVHDKSLVIWGVLFVFPGKCRISGCKWINGRGGLDDALADATRVTCVGQASDRAKDTGPRQGWKEHDRSRGGVQASQAR